VENELFSTKIQTNSKEGPREKPKGLKKATGKMVTALPSFFRKVSVTDKAITHRSAVLTVAMRETKEKRGDLAGRRTA